MKSVLQTTEVPCDLSCSHADNPHSGSTLWKQSCNRLPSSPPMERRCLFSSVRQSTWGWRYSVPVIPSKLIGALGTPSPHRFRGALPDHLGPQRRCQFLRLSRWPQISPHNMNAPIQAMSASIWSPLTVLCIHTYYFSCHLCPSMKM